MTAINNIETRLSHIDVGHLTAPTITRPEREPAESKPTDAASVEFQKLSAGILVADSGPAGLVNAVRHKPEDLAQPETGSTAPVVTASTQPIPEPVTVGTTQPGLRSQVEQYNTEQPVPRLSVDA